MLTNWAWLKFQNFMGSNGSILDSLWGTGHPLPSGIQNAFNRFPNVFWNLHRYLLHNRRFHQFVHRVLQEGSISDEAQAHHVSVFEDLVYHRPARVNSLFMVYLIRGSLCLWWWVIRGKRDCAPLIAASSAT
jgi:hypothetical protein